MDAHRTGRVSEAVREELAEIIGFELSDPRLGSVTVTDVHVAPDMRNASVKVGLVGDDQAQRQSLEALEHARGFLRHQIARRLNLRRSPDLHFEPDRFTNVDERVELLLKRARRTRAREEAPAAGEPPDVPAEGGEKG